MEDRELYLKLLDDYRIAALPATEAAIKELYNRHFPNEKPCSCGNKVGKMLLKLRKKLMRK